MNILTTLNPFRELEGAQNWLGIDNLSEARAGIASVTFNNATLFAGGLTKVTYPAAGSATVDIYTAL